MDRKLHILYIVQYFNHPDEAGGSRPNQLARRWAARGHQVTELTSNLNHKTLSPTSSVTADDRVTVIRVRTYNQIRGSFRRRIINFLSFAVMAFVRGMWVRRVDLVYASSTPLTTGLAGYLIGALKRRPFYFEVRDLWPEAAVAAGALKPGWILYVAEWFERLFYRKAVKVIALSEGFRAGVIAKGKPPSRCALRPQRHGRLDARCESGDSSDYPFDTRTHFICTYIGAHGRWNKLETILEAAHLLAGTRVRFLLIGDGDYKDELKRYADSLHLTNVCFLDAVPKKSVFDYLNLSHVALICVWDYEFHAMILANKVFDYMAAGRPVVAATRGETEALLHRAGCGWSVPPEHPDRLATLLKDIAALPPEELQTRGLRGREYVRQHFLRSDLADDLQRMFAQGA